MRKRKTISTKNMIEVLDYHTAQTYIKNKKRRPKVNVTPEDVKKNNEKKAEDDLRLLIDNNFSADDHYITLTYAELPTEEQAKVDIRNFFRKLSYRYKKAKEILKYIYICEGKKRIHFHILINNAIKLGIKELKKLWTHGHVHKSAYQGEAEDAKRMASYFIKEKKASFYNEKPTEMKFKQRWVASKNLKKPVVHTRTLKATEWKAAITAPKGYYVETDSITSGVNIAGYPYRFYRLIKIKTITEVRLNRRI